MLRTFFLDIGFGYRLQLNEILALMPLDIVSVYRLMKQHRKANTLIRATRGRKGLTLILMKNNTAYVSAYTSEELEANIYEFNLIKRRGEWVNTSEEN